MIVAAPAPVPVRLTVCGLPATLSTTLIVPVVVPVAAGVNVTLIVQAAPDVSEVPQLLVWPKFALAVMEVIASVTLPMLVSVTVCAALVVPTVCDANVRVLGRKAYSGRSASSEQAHGLRASGSVVVNRHISGHRGGECRRERDADRATRYRWQACAGQLLVSPY